MAETEPQTATPDVTPDPGAVGDPAQSTAGTRMQVRVDDRNMATHYVNAFRPHPAGEEMVLDVGFNLVERVPRPDAGEADARDGQSRFQIHDRLVMSYTTAKRLTLALGQIVQRYEQRFGPIQITRQAPPAGGNGGGQQSTEST